MPLTDLQAKQVEFLSHLQLIANGGREDYFRWRWGESYEENIKCLKNLLAKLLSQPSSWINP